MGAVLHPHPNSILYNSVQDRARGTLRYADGSRNKEVKVTGKVKWFNESKGYGFITPDDGGKDLFCHQSEIRMEGFRTLAEGQAVEFDVEPGPKGPAAKNVRSH